MTADWQDLSFRVKMVDGCSLVAPRDQTQAFILDELKLVDGSRGEVREDDGGRVIEERSDHRLKR